MSILLIEDDRDLALLWKEYLVAKGFTTTVKHSVTDAANALATGPPELLIVDYTLPDGTAVDVLEHLPLTLPRPHIVVCSGHGRDLPPQLLEAGIHVLAKPFRLDQLHGIVRALLGPPSPHPG